MNDIPIGLNQGLNEAGFTSEYNIVKDLINLIAFPNNNDECKAIIAESQNEKLKTLLNIIVILLQIDIQNKNQQVICLFSSSDRVISIYNDFVVKLTKYYKVKTALLIRNPPVKVDITQAQLILSIPVQLDQAIDSKIQLDKIKVFTVDDADIILTNKTLMNFYSFIFQSLFKTKAQFLLFSSTATKSVYDIITKFIPEISDIQQIIIKNEKPKTNEQIKPVIDETLKTSEIKDMNNKQPKTNEQIKPVIKEPVKTSEIKNENKQIKSEISNTTKTNESKSIVSKQIEKQKSCNNLYKKQNMPNLSEAKSTGSLNNEIDQLPSSLTFKDPNIVKNYDFNGLWPQCKTVCVEFFPDIQVPVTFVSSENSKELEKQLLNHSHQNIVIADAEYTKSVWVIGICTKNGVLIVQDKKSSEPIRNFLKNTPFFSKGKVDELEKYVNNGKLEAIDINDTYIIPKRYSYNFDNLINSILGKSTINFRPKPILRSNWSKPLSIAAVLFCAYNVASVYMILPIIQSAPKMFVDVKSPPQTISSCMKVYFKFHEQKDTIVTFISDEKEDSALILPMIESLYDNKAYVTGSFNGLFGYGTSNGILITKNQVDPFEHVNIPFSNDAYDANIFKKYASGKQQFSDIVQLAIKISCTLNSSKIERQLDPTKRNVPFPTFQNYNAAKIETQTKKKSVQKVHKKIQSKITILPLPINPELYIHFSAPALESIQVLNDIGFNIPFAQSYNIDKMLNSIHDDNITDELEGEIKQLISNFPKIEQNDLLNILNDYEPEKNEKDNFIKIIDSGDFYSLSETDVEFLLSILNRFCKTRNHYISQLASLNVENENEINSIMIELFTTIQPSEQLVDKIVDILSENEFDPEKFLNQFSETLRSIRKMSIRKREKEKLIDLFNITINNLTKFASTNKDCFEQVHLIEKALLNLKFFDSKLASYEEINLFISNATKMMNAADIYIRFMNTQTDKSIRKIENLLFKMVFTPSDDKSPYTQVYAVYEIHDKFLFNQDQFVNFKSSTGSGKTRCAPFIFSIKAHLDQMERPFFVMTQPGASIISDKMKDFRNVLGRNIILVSKVSELIKLYKEGEPQKPVVALFSLHNAICLLTESERLNIDIISKTRFCLDEIHERSVDTDIFIAKLSEKLKGQKTFPLHVLMMSATPDIRVLNCFGEVNNVELPDSQLFPVETIQKEVESRRDIINEAASQTLNILNKMAEGAKKLGHILVFTSGNSRINEFVKNIVDKIKENKYYNDKTENDNTDNDNDNDNHIDLHITNRARNIRNIKLIQDIAFDDEKSFYNKVDEVIKKDKRSLYIIPIKFAGFVSTAQKEIAKNIIRKHKNVIKIIIATNAIESSITIDQLSAVVDTGIFNQPLFDTQRGLTKLSEEPISIQSQTQRKGRVGRVRPGISVQIKVKDLSFKEFLPPEIQSTDISSNILSLRKIGIKLELIKNLPDPIDPKVLQQFMEELYSIGAIDKTTGNLTEKGEKISKFESLSPFLVASVIRAASIYQENRVLIEVLGSLIILIFNSELVINEYAQPLQENFNEDSDVITILKTFLDLVCTKSWKLKAEKFGLNNKIATSIFSVINKISENLKIPTESKHIFLQLKEISEEIDLMIFIQSIIDNIEFVKSSWIRCRKATFLTIDYLRTDPIIIYNGDKSLVFDDKENQSEIRLKTRPGSKGLISPGSAYIFNISHSESTIINYGSIIHRNIKEDPILKNEESYKFVRPKILEADISLYSQEEFSSCLLNAFLQGKENEFRTFNMMKHKAGENGNAIFYISIFSGKCIFSYAPINKDIDNTFKEEVKRISILLPFTPSAILIKYPPLNCAIALRFTSIDKSNSSIHFFKDNDCFPYQINKDILNYLIDHVNELSSIDNKTFIAITGEVLSIPLEASSNTNFSKIRNPTIDPDINYVFSNDPKFYNHMVIISNKEIPGQVPIPWIKNAIYPDYERSDYMIAVANSIFPDLINISKCEKRVFFIPTQSTKKPIKANIVSIDEDDLEIINNAENPINKLFESATKECISKNRLIKSISLISFECGSPTLPSIFYNEFDLKIATENMTLDDYNRFFNQENPDEFQQSIRKIKQLQDRKEEIILEQNNLNKLWNETGDKSTIKNQQKLLKTEKLNIELKIKELYGYINKLKSHPKTKDMYDPKFEQILRFPSAAHFEVAKKLVENDYHISSINKKREISLDIPLTIRDEEKPSYIKKFLEIIKPIIPDETYKFDELPLYKIIINHTKDSPVDEYVFENIIQNICHTFGAIISRVSKYYSINSDRNYTNLGNICVYMYSSTFAIPFVTMVAESIYRNDYAILRIPKELNIDSNFLIHNPEMNDFMLKWIENNHLNIKPSKNKWIGSQDDVTRAEELLRTKPPKFPVKLIPIPGGVDLISLNNSVKKQAKLGKRKWTLNFATRTLTVPSDSDEEKIKSFIDKYQQTNKNKEEDNDELEYIGDVAYCCEDAPLSTKLVNIYQEDGTVITKNFCKTCIRDSLIYSLGRLYDENNDIPIMNRIFENTEFINPIALLFSKEGNPFIPIGQLLWSFIFDSSIATPARSYITALALQTLKKSPYVTCCPQHPTILFKKPPNGTLMKCIINDCFLRLCNRCNKWHDYGSCSTGNTIPLGCRICPNCKAIIEKSEACNHIACSCGKHFCYYCGEGPWDSSDLCYNHLSEKHIDCFNNPPDYKRFIQKITSVTDEELDEFYLKYPKLRDFEI